MQRSILVLILTLSLVVVLTALMFENSPSGDVPASRFDRRAANAMVSTPAPTLSAETLVKLGGEDWRRGNLEAAERQFQQALDLQPDNPDILQALGQVAYARGDYAMAAGHFERYLERCPERVESYTNLAITLLCMDNLDRAEQVAREGLDKAGKDTPGPFCLILACVNDRKGHSEEEAVYLQHAYDALGSQLLTLVNTRWAATIKDSNEYKAIVAAEAQKQSTSDGASPMRIPSGLESMATPLP